MLVDAGKIQVIKVPRVLSVETVDKFHEELGSLVNKRPTLVELDCSQIDLVTSSHINLLWEARTLCLENNLNVKLSFVSPGVIRVLKVLDLHDIFLGKQTEPKTDTLNDNMENRVKDERELKLEFRSETGAITRCLADFRLFLSRLNLPMKFVIELEIVFYEVATNIRLHSGLGTGDVIVFDVASQDDKIIMIFTDRGKSFDPTMKGTEYEPGKVIRERKKRGFGLTMISRMTDRMIYRRLEDSINVLTLEKNWR